MQTGRDASRGAARWARYPPGLEVLHVPLADRRATWAALGVHNPCRRAPLLAHRAQMAAVRALGPRALAGRRQGRPVEQDVVESLTPAWAEALGRVDGAALLLPRQRRARFAALLLRGGEPIAFVKLRQGGGAGDHEADVLRVLGGAVGPVRAPRLLGTGDAGDWSWMAVEAMEPGFHRPAQLSPGDLAAVLADVRARLAGLPRDGAPAHWEPAHGDLAPWNLRRTARSTWLLDWEEARWAPPGWDEVYLEATSAVVDGRPARPSAHHEALGAWCERVERRAAEEGDDQLAGALLTTLRGMKGPGRAT